MSFSALLIIPKLGKVLGCRERGVNPTAPLSRKSRQTKTDSEKSNDGDQGGVYL